MVLAQDLVFGLATVGIHVVNLVAHLDAKDDKITKKRKGYTVQRYKGLGEMDPKQLASTTMDPKTRIRSAPRRRLHRS